MKNLKKALAVALVMALAFSFGVINVAAFSDVADDASYAEAVTILSNLGLLKGYEDGTFGPDKTITRAEFSAVVVRAMGMASSEESMRGTTVFSDVTADYEWASGYINIAQQQGLIAGMGDGTFAPGSPVTYEQAVKMIVAALGYTPKADVSGGYPSGYLAIASQEGITKGATGTIGTDAKRATVARLVYNALEVEMMEQTTFVIGAGAEFSTNGKTLLNNYLDVYKVDAIVTGTYLTKAMDNGEYNANDTDIELTLTANVYESASKDASIYVDEDGQDYDKNARLIFSEGNTAAAQYLGYAVSAYVGEDEDTDEQTIFAIALKSGKNNVLELSKAQIGESGQKPSNAKSSYFYYWKGSSETDSKISYAEIDPYLTTFVNYELDNISVADFVDGETILDEAGYLENGGKITLIDNDNDSDYDFALILSYTDELVVESIDVDDSEYEFTSYTGTSLSVDLEDEDVKYIFYKDGDALDIDDIAVGDVITVVGDEGNHDPIIIGFVSSTTVEGSVGEISTVEPKDYTIDGTDYKLSPLSGDSLEVGYEGIFYINFEGEIAYADATGTSSGNYALLIGADYDSSFGQQTITLQFVDTTGSVLTRDLVTKNVKVRSDVTADGVTSSKQQSVDPLTSSVLDGKLYTLTKSGSQVTNVTAIPQLFKYTLNSSGKVSAIQLAGTKDDKYFYVEGNSNTERSYDSDTDSLGSYDFDDNTIAFAVKMTRGEFEAASAIEDDDVSVSKPSKLFRNGQSGYNFTVYDNDSNGVAKVILGFNITADVDPESHVFVVTSTKQTAVGDEEAIALVGYQNGKEVTYTVCEDKETSKTEGGIQNPDIDDASEITKGMVLLISNGASGYVENIKVLMNAVAPADDPRTTIEDLIEAGYAFEDRYALKDSVEVLASVLDRSNSKVALGDVPTLYANKGYDVVKSNASASYTLIDYSGSGNRMNISKGKYSDIKSNGTTYVYARWYDEALKDVVIYKFDK